MSVIYRKKVCKSWDDFYADQIIETIWYPRYNQISIFFSQQRFLDKKRINIKYAYLRVKSLIPSCVVIVAMFVVFTYFLLARKLKFFPFSKGSLLLLLTLWLRNFRVIIFRQGDKKMTMFDLFKCIILHCLKSCVVCCFPLFLLTKIFNHMTLSFQRSQEYVTQVVDPCPDIQVN